MMSSKLTELYSVASGIIGWVNTNTASIRDHRLQMAHVSWLDPP